MDVRLFIKQRLQQLELEQRDLAAAVQVTESYISQLLRRRKAPPAADRTDLYERMNTFLKLPKGKLSAMVEAQRREELKKKLAEPPVPLLKEVRELVIRKCQSERQGQICEIFERQAFGELERLVTQKLLDVTRKVAKDELRNEDRLATVGEPRNRSDERMQENTVAFLDRDLFNVSPDDCSAFLDPIIDSWDIDLKTLAIEIVLNRPSGSTQLMRFCFVEAEPDGSVEEEPGFQEFLRNPAMSADATEEEIEFLKSLRFKHHRPGPLYYYRELQSLRDPLHFGEPSVALMHKHRDASELEKQLQLDSRKRAIQRWAKNKINPTKKKNNNNGRPSAKPSRRPGRTDIN